MNDFEQTAPWKGSVKDTFQAALDRITEALAELGGDLDSLHEEDEDASYFLETALETKGTPPALTKEQLLRIFATERPKEEELESSAEKFEEVTAELACRGACYHVVFYEDEAPASVYFFGWSLD